MSLLLLLAVLPLFFSAPTPHSQTLTTITSLQTITTESTVTTARPVTSYMTKTTVLTEFSTTTSYYPKARVVYKSKYLLGTVSSPYDCLYYNYAFSAKKNEVLAVNLTSTRPIAFFVVSNEAFKAWKAKGFCEVEDSLHEAWQVQEYSQRLVIPNEGSYQLIFENWSHENAAWIDIVAHLSGVLSESSLVVTASTVLTSRSTMTETYPTTITRVLTSVRTEEIGVLQQNTLLISAAAVVVVALVGVLLIKRRKTCLPTQIHEPSKAVSLALLRPEVARVREQGQRYVEYLAKLEKLRTRGDISEETYLKLKDEYSRELKR